MPNAPAASCAIVVIERTRVTTSTPESPGIPARNGFTAYVVLSPATGYLMHTSFYQRSARTKNASLINIR
jgi:hypothetical protein